MDFLNNNKLFCASSLATFFFGVHVLKESFQNIKEAFSAQVSEEDKLTAEVTKLIKTPNLKSKRIASLPRLDGTVNANSVELYKICLTGGPCGGKTTALAQLNERLTERGFKVFIVPETPTMTMEGGGMINMANYTQDKISHFQSSLMKMQMALEDYFTDLANLSGKPSIILCDRGVMDPHAYMSEEVWQIILDEQGWNPVNLRDKRYDAVIHLVTAADGAEEFYTKGNNQARYESVEDAIQTDRRIQTAWNGHPHFNIIDNNVKSFNHKMNKLYSTLCKFIGIPISSRFFRKYLINPKYEFPHNLNVEIFTVEETFLKSEDGIQRKLRKRGQGETFSYMHSIRRTIVEGERNEIKKPISAREYLLMLDQKDENRKTLKKIRKCFIWKSRYYIIDLIENEKDTLHLLRFDTHSKEEESVIPEFLEVLSEVTDNKKYDSYTISEKN